MENPRILVDTSVIIDFLRKQYKEKTLLWALKENNTCFMSSVTYFELLAGATNDSKQDDIKKVCKWIPVLDFEEGSARFAAEIYRELKKDNNLVEFRDIFIAATALQHDFPLASLNNAHFERIKSLHLHPCPLPS
ncbi:type II toxin-antitoxin system VapC family toxin [Desulfonatronum thioautotrophicum]|uniref:type II toxin-antitoxin system VapC family toxin n=1 Tax=Desulfonatronum thioautotrophicum TaxID=617001 RepID=UPI0009FCDB27|nr:type II toxin-antitoxin system VapC family toxin [Desulfonatronum thioautotrophicum]